jgi:DNA-binding winged helix-turn-helix (wHTH) protein
MTARANGVYLFGQYRLDAAGTALFNGTTLVPLTPKALKVLLTLVERAGAVVDKETLLQEVWADTFVEEGIVAHNISTLRHVLRNGRDSVTIQTLPKRGYRLVGDVRLESCDDAEVLASPVTAIANAAALDAPAAGPAATDLQRWLIAGDRQIPLRDGAQTVGRDRSADIRLDSLSVSRCHARLTVAGAEITVEDLGSKNGTWLRRARLTGPTRLEDGDDVRFGTVTVILRNLLAPGATDTTPA